jgi:hypothetical protein
MTLNDLFGSTANCWNESTSELLVGQQNTTTPQTCLGITPADVWQETQLDEDGVFAWCDNITSFDANHELQLAKYCYDTNRTLFRMAAGQVKNGTLILKSHRFAVVQNLLPVTIYPCPHSTCVRVFL